MISSTKVHTTNGCSLLGYALYQRTFSFVRFRRSFGQHARSRSRVASLIVPELHKRSETKQAGRWAARANKPASVTSTVSKV
jgi:hypothetical protein